MPTILGRQPAVIVTVVMAVAAALATYGLNIVPDPDKFSTALLAVLTLLASGAVIHTQVTPTAAPVLALGTPVTTPGGDTANPTLIVSGASPNHP
jgi:hypothetical protein